MGAAPRAADGRRVAKRRPAPTSGELDALMREYRGNVTHVAHRLGRQWTVVWRCLQRYGLDPADYRPRRD
jgi:hypothetical protein